MNTYTVKLHADPENPVDVVARTTEEAHRRALEAYEREAGHQLVRGATIRLARREA